MDIKEIYEKKIREVFYKIETFLGETFRITVNEPTKMCDYIKSIDNPFIDLVEVDGNDVIIIYHTASHLAETDSVHKLNDFCMEESYLTFKKIEENTVIDENQSVKWNREEVKRINEENLEKKKQERHYHNLLGRAVSTVIKASVNSWYMTSFSDKTIDIIFNKAWEDGHSYGFSEVYSYFQEYMDMFVDACKAMNYI